MSSTTAYQAIREQVCQYMIDSSSCDFNTVAQALHCYQLAHNAPYHKLCHHAGDYALTDWRQHPALSTDTFKLEDAPSCLAPSERSITYMTSGTTQDIRGMHHFRNTELYQHSVLQAWQQLQLPPIRSLYILTAPPSQAPHSSLSSMMEILKQHHAPEASYLIDEERLDIQALIAAADRGEDVTLLGTSLAFLNLFELLGDHSLRFGKHSWAMETGGYKGSGRTLSKEHLYQQFHEVLGLAPDMVWNEYSMTELSSQCYTQGLDRVHRSPHWMKIQVLSPETDQAVAPGAMGYLTIYDLANVDSVAAIRTQDLAIYHDEHHFTLIGRDPSALPRGCSRAMDAALNQAH
ncbi:hypothetical protein [Rubritalea marina]|uniref:LuxE/PaaK family acyltransferase n=1 Tax=Rubritalea marina TaxID=361055 RepID=UPI0003746698|nr:hypothetical protein [Rubritalea marina]